MKPKEVACPDCGSTQLTTRASTANAGSADRFIDDAKRQHVHDTNIYTTTYECENGHTFDHRHRVVCPTKVCRFSKADVT